MPSGDLRRAAQQACITVRRLMLLPSWPSVFAAGDAHEADAPLTNAAKNAARSSRGCSSAPRIVPSTSPDWLLKNVRLPGLPWTGSQA